MDKLPPELVVEILLKLSVKPLCRFKIVSKSFWTLISHPRFAKVRLSRTQRRKLLFISEVLSSVDLQATFDGKLVIDKFDYPTEEKPDPWISVYNSFNGLFCISHKSGVYMLHNPYTRESKKMPDSQSTSARETLSGFGYVESIDDYKFVKVFGNKKVHVFSQRDSSWRIVEVNFPLRVSELTFPSIIGIPLNGAIHWIVRRRGEMVIAAFDLVEEKYRLLSLPDSIPRPQSCIYLRALGDCLCIFYGERVKTFWIMEEYNVKDSWIRFLTTDISPYIPAAPLCLWNNKGVIIVAENRINREWAICYQQDEESCRDLGIPIQISRPTTGVHAYMESLVSVHYNSDSAARRRDDYFLKWLE